MALTPKDNRRIKDISQTLLQPYFILLQDDSRKQGIILLRSSNEKAISVIVPYYYFGVHDRRLEEDWKHFNNKVGSTFASFRTGLSFKFEYSCFGKKLESAEDFTRHLSGQTKNTEIAYSLSKQDIRKQLSQQGKLNDIQQVMTISYRFGSDHALNGKGWYDHLLITLQSLWHSFKGITSEVKEQSCINLLHEVYQSNKDIEQNFSPIGLPLRAFSLEECYRKYMEETAFNCSDQPDNFITFNPQTGKLSERISQPDLDVRTQRYQDCLPVVLPHELKIKDMSVQAFIYDRKTSGWTSEEDCALYIWNLVKEFSNIKVITQITPLDTRKQKPQLELKEKTTSYEIDADVTNAKSELIHEDVIEANFALEEGQVVFQVAFVILIYGNPKQLHSTFRQLSHRVVYPARLVREEYDCWNVYNQAQFHSPAKLCTVPFGRTFNVLSSNLIGFLPLIKPQSPYQKGYEMIGQGGTPITIDYRQPRNSLVIGMTRSGKSLFIADLLLFLYTKYNIPILIVDFPRSDGTSTFTTLSNLMDGAYVNVATEICNLFELPTSTYVDYLDCLDNQEFRDFKDDLAVMLNRLLIGTDEVSPDYKQEVEVVIGLALEYFFNDEGIKERYRIAYSSDDWDSEQRAVMPILLDFIEILIPENFPNKNLNIQALARIKNRLEVLSKGSCRCLSGVSTVKSNDTELLVYALTKMSREQDAVIYGFMGYLLILRQSAKHEKYLVFIDEASILLRYDALSKLFGKLSANGNKAGIYLFFAAQDLESIAQCAGSDQILANISTTYVGKIKPVAVDNLQKAINCDRSLLEINTTKTFGQHGEELSSDWLVADIEGDVSHVKYFISPFLLALTANTPSEEKARNLLMSYFDDPLEALIKFASILKHCIAQGILPDQYVLDLIEQANQQDIGVPDFINQCY